MFLMEPNQIEVLSANLTCLVNYFDTSRVFRQIEHDGSIKNDQMQIAIPYERDSYSDK